MAENALKSRRNKSFLDGTGKICYRGGEVIDMTIPQNLKDLRRLSGMTQEQVAEKVGLTRQAISSYESGRTQPDLALLDGLYQPIDYYLPVELMVLPPVVLLLLWWGILALVRRKKDRSAI